MCAGNVSKDPYGIRVYPTILQGQASAICSTWKSGAKVGPLASGVIELVEFVEWAAPSHQKRWLHTHLWGLSTVNKVAKVDSYPLPRIDDLFASLVGGKLFSKLDLAHAYQQISLAEESKKFVVINTHKGLYRYNCLPFGISSVPAIFQRMTERILQGIPMSQSISPTSW